MFFCRRNGLDTIQIANPLFVGTLTGILLRTNPVTLLQTRKGKPELSGLSRDFPPALASLAHPDNPWSLHKQFANPSFVGTLTGILLRTIPVTLLQTRKGKPELSGLSRDFPPALASLAHPDNPWSLHKQFANPSFVGTLTGILLRTIPVTLLQTRKGKPELSGLYRDFPPALALLAPPDNPWSLHKRRTQASLCPSFLCRDGGISLSRVPAFLSSVGTAGFEPTTPCTPYKCATGLRHVPNVSLL